MRRRLEVTGPVPLNPEMIYAVGTHLARVHAFYFSFIVYYALPFTSSISGTWMVKWLWGVSFISLSFDRETAVPLVSKSSIPLVLPRFSFNGNRSEMVSLRDDWLWCYIKTNLRCKFLKGISRLGEHYAWLDVHCWRILDTGVYHMIFRSFVVHSKIDRFSCMCISSTDAKNLSPQFQIEDIFFSCSVINWITHASSMVSLFKRILAW